MRIVGGKFAGRDLTSPGKTRVRPTSEHVRAALLDALRAEVDGARVLDLFAGTGALGLEALSRGAKYADFVEMNAAALHALKANVARLRLTKQSRIFVKDAIHFADALPPDRYDICFADPPYESKQLDWLIRIWHARRFSPILVVEHAHSHDVPRGATQLGFETTRVTIYRRAADTTPAAVDATDTPGIDSAAAVGDAGRPLKRATPIATPRPKQSHPKESRPKESRPKQSRAKARAPSRPRRKP